MERKERKTIKLVAATSCCLFSLVAAFAASFAWFSNNLNVKNNGMQLTVETLQSSFSKMTLHKYLGESNNNLLFNKEASGKFEYNFITGETTYTGTSADAFMGRFSLMEPRHPFLALIEYSSIITADSGNNRISIHGDTEHYFIGALNSETGTFYEELNASGNPLSSIVRFSSSSYTSLSTGSITVEDTNYATYNFATPNSWQHFVDIEKAPDGSLVYDEEDGWNPSKTFFEATSGNIKYIAIIFDYYDEALEYIYNIYLGNEFLERDIIPFSCDWKMVI